MRRVAKKVERVLGLLLIKFAPVIRPGLATKIGVFWYKRWGMRFVGRPNYISARINFDGTDYGHIEIHEGVTISSYVRILTHYWSLYTISKSVGHFSDKPIGKIKGVKIGAYSFVGTGSIIMPGADIGQGCLIGAGTVVRGKVPDFSVVIGSLGKIVGDSREVISRQFDIIGIAHPAGLRGVE